jgi:ribosome maturation factor RimP
MGDLSPQTEKAPNAKPGRVDVEAIRALVSPLLLAHGMELFDLEWTTGPLGRVLRVIIERPVGPEVAQPGSGVTLDDCVHVSRDLSTALDVTDLLPLAYSLEVSSPGLDRPLVRAADFKRQLGKLAKVKLVEPAPDGQRVLRGTIAGVDEECIRLDVDGNLHEVRIDQMKEAKLVFELGGQPKKGPRPHKAPRPPKAPKRTRRKAHGAKKTAG